MTYQNRQETQAKDKLALLLMLAAKIEDWDDMIVWLPEHDDRLIWSGVHEENRTVTKVLK